MNGSIVAGGILLTTAVFGAGLYYTQVYAYYDKIPADAPQARMEATTFGGVQEQLLVSDFKGIDADTSPIKFRACFQTPMSVAMMTETFAPYDEATPLIAPSWFNCFDAKSLSEDLAAGDAVAFMSAQNITYGVDRVIAVYPDGRAFAWHQINECGATVYDGDAAPEGCPPAPDGL